MKNNNNNITELSWSDKGPTHKVDSTIANCHCGELANMPNELSNGKFKNIATGVGGKISFNDINSVSRWYRGGFVTNMILNRGNYSHLK